MAGQPIQERPHDVIRQIHHHALGNDHGWAIGWHVIEEVRILQRNHVV